MGRCPGARAPWSAGAFPPAQVPCVTTAQRLTQPGTRLAGRNHLDCVTTAHLAGREAWPSTSRSTAEGKMCQHQPRCPQWPAPDHLAARIVADQPGQGWSLLCNGVILFDDGGELLPDGRAVTPDRVGLRCLVAVAA